MNKTINAYLYIIILCILISACKKKSEKSAEPLPLPPAPPEWSFESTATWSDEFSTDGLPDAAKWGYDIGGHGWGNNELQYYTDAQNVSVSGGILKITAKKESYLGNNYSSARMITKNKGDWLYGRIEVKAKLPAGRGTWPAIWMLPTDWAYGNWPNSGEMDIMEHVGYDPNRVHITIHTKAYNHTLGTQKSASKIVSNAMTEFHRYRLDWAPYGIRGYIDDEQIFEFMNTTANSDQWPFDKKFHLLLNIAVGGSWGGAQGVDDTVFPATLEVDYVRVYKFVK
jgi:beta-glucanase (GH16 family)